jgi:hypothetical protein
MPHLAATLPLALALLLTGAGTAPAAEITGNRQFAEFAYSPSTTELAAASRWGREHFAKAKAAGRPVEPRVARMGGTVLISLESVAICDRVRACPLLVFRDVTKPPVLKTFAFQNLRIEYREKGTFLIVRRWESTAECLITTVAKAMCKEIKPSKRQTSP